MHLEELANELESFGLERAAATHKDFSVTPHATWLAMKGSGKRSRESYRKAGYLGGTKNSLRKKSASVENGRLGGRPRKNYQDLIDRLVRMAKDPTSDPMCPPEFVPKLLRQMSSLPIRARAKLRAHFRSAGIDPKQFGLLAPIKRKKPKPTDSRSHAT